MPNLGGGLGTAERKADPALPACDSMACRELSAGWRIEAGEEDVGAVVGGTIGVDVDATEDGRGDSASWNRTLTRSSGCITSVATDPAPNPATAWSWSQNVVAPWCDPGML